MEEKTIQEKAQRLVWEYVESHLEKTDKTVIYYRDVYIVWFSKTLQNWKALLSTTLPDGMYYEVTYNGNKHETYIDAYKKFDNVVVKDSAEKVSTDVPAMHSDETLNKAMDALKTNGYTEGSAAQIINVLLNNGFLIRERLF